MSTQRPTDDELTERTRQEGATRVLETIQRKHPWAIKELERREREKAAWRAKHRH
jgi:hypothetical protein